MHQTEVSIRFSEVDALGIVWHGHYIKYMEDGREAFGIKYGISYLDVQKAGYIVPLVKVNCEYKRPSKRDAFLYHFGCIMGIKKLYIFIAALLQQKQDSNYLT